jgi:hypothetical protein
MMPLTGDLMKTVRLIENMKLVVSSLKMSSLPNICSSVRRVMD